MMLMKRVGRLPSRHNKYYFIIAPNLVAASTLSAQSFFESATRITQKAFSQANTTSQHDILIAGLNVRLLFAGAIMPPLVMPALTHLKSPLSNTAPDFFIHIWDSVSSNQSLPDFPGKLDDILLRGEIAGLNNERYYSAFFPYARMLSLYDAKQRTGIICTSDPSIMPAFEIACPLRSVLSWILKSNSRVLIHAAAIGTKDGAVLLGGDGGAGKSSTALRSLISGMQYVGDDICCLENRPDGSYAHSVYSSAKLHAYDSPNFPELNCAKFDSQARFHNEKQMYFLSPHFDRQLTPSLPIRAILVPDHTGGPLRFEKISTAYAAKVMTASTNCLLPRAGIETFSALSHLLRQTPCLRLHLGPDPKAVAPSIAQYLEHNHH